MPIFEYQCMAGHVSEAMRPLSEFDANVDCPYCERTAKRIMSATPTTFKFADSSGRKRSRGNAQDIVRNTESFKSPIDGTVISSQRGLNEHMKKHGVVPYEPGIRHKKHDSAKAEKEQRIAVLRDAYEHSRDKSRYSRN